MGPVAEALLLLSMLLARRARNRRRWPACAGHVLAAVRLAAAAGGLAPPTGCAPVRHSRGGFFTAIVETAEGPRFAKGVPANCREARFWAAWRRGAIRSEGAHYRLVPPEAVVTGRAVSVLIFPVVTGLRATRTSRERLFRRHAPRVVRAIADFNSDHPSPPEILAPARGCGPVPVPGRRRIAAALKVDRTLAEAIARELPAIEAGWGRVRDAVERGDRCLCHMDLGLGNIVIGDPPAILLDFGHAGVAPVGADLHTVLRKLGPDGPDVEMLVATYAAVFAAKGLAADPVAIRLSLEAHFAARYRDLRFASARNLATYRAALALSRRLIEAADA